MTTDKFLPMRMNKIKKHAYSFSEYAKKYKTAWRKVYNSIKNKIPSPVLYGRPGVNLNEKIADVFPEERLLKRIIYKTLFYIVLTTDKFLPMRMNKRKKHAYSFSEYAKKHKTAWRKVYNSIKNKIPSPVLYRKTKNKSK